MSAYTEILKYEDGNNAPLPSVNEFIKICGVTDDNPKSVKALHGLIMESLHMDLFHSPEKQALLFQTKKVLEKLQLQG